MIEQKGTPMHDLWFIAPTDFLSRMVEKDRAELLRKSSKQYFSKDEHIFQVGSPGNNIYVLLEGRMKIYQLSSMGKEIILWFCLPGEVFGLAETPRGGRRMVYAQACSASEVLTISRTELNQFLHDHPSTALLIIDLLACRLRCLGDMLLNLTVDNVTSRVVKLLIRLAARYGRQLGDEDIYLDINLTHQEIADMVGATRQTVTSVLGELKRKGILRIENHCIHIQSQEILESLINNSQNTPRLTA
jgi:CRP/FNR family transcriptional regulator, cyclic AMP receptor protein